MTADEETDVRISDYELMMADLRDGWRTARRLLARIALALIVMGVYMYVTGLIDGIR